MGEDNNGVKPLVSLGVDKDKKSVVRIWDDTRPVYPLRFEDGGVCWKNVFRGWFKVLLVVVFIIGLVLLYRHDIGKCDEVISDPCGFCEGSGCCDLINSPGFSKEVGFVGSDAPVYSG